MTHTEGYVDVTAMNDAEATGSNEAADAIAASAQEQKESVAVSVRLEYIAEELAAALQKRGNRSSLPAGTDSDPARRLPEPRATDEQAKPAPNAVSVGMKGVQDNAPGFSQRRFGLASAAEEVPEDAPRVLVMAQGKTARQSLPVIAQAGMRTIAPVTADRRLDSAPKQAHEMVDLGEKYTPALFENAFAVLQAARSCRADAVFLCDGAANLATDERFLQKLHRMGIVAFTPTTPEIAFGWTECVPENAAGAAETDLPDTTDWRVCPHCKLTFDALDFVENGYRCPSCAALTRMDSNERIAQILDEGSFQEWDPHMPDADPLAFEGYQDKVASLRLKTGLDEAVRCGRGTIGGLPVALGIMEPSFFIGSMGSVVGEKVSRLFDRATDEGLPVVVFCASGGARMQEGLISLMQMAKTSCAVERHDKAGLLYVAVLTDPTTGGVTASFATEGDIILAEPGALIGFAGQRVIRDTIKQELPEGFQTAEFALAHGLIDRIVEREDLRDELGRILALHDPQAALDSPYGPQFAGSYPEAGAVTISDIAKRGERRLDFAAKIPFVSRFVQSGDPVKQLERHAARELRKAGIPQTTTPGSAWESVQMARNVHRPTSVKYLNALTDGFIELHGDRAFGDDGAIMAGIGWVDGQPATIIAQEKGVDLNERIRRNFGCPQPEGYRKGIRLMKQAEKFGRAVVCLVDTQGAFCGTEAEERGQGNAIADSLVCMASLHVPVVSVLVGEGGSGGALALAVGNRVAMQEHAVYSVLSPEGFASILWKDRSRAPEAAEAMRMSADEVHRMGVIDDILFEGESGAHENPEEAIRSVTDYVTHTLRELRPLSGEMLYQQRHERFAKF